MDQGVDLGVRILDTRIRQHDRDSA
jgi:hypothetical protein